MTYKYSPLIERRIEDSPRFRCWIESLMWLFNFIFYWLVLAIPIALPTANACEQGHEWEAHGFIACLLALMSVFELIVLLLLKHRLRDEPRLFGLKNVSMLWKVMSSLLARIDLYTDICFIVILRHCQHKNESSSHFYRSLEQMCLVSIILSVTVPALFLLRLLAAILSERCNIRDVANPKMERIARLAYASEFKGIAAIVGSFCVDLKLRLCCEISLPRFFSVYKLVFEDLLQALAQIAFTWVVHSNSFVIVSILISALSLFASFANVFITTGAKPSQDILTRHFKASAPPWLQ